MKYSQNFGKIVINIFFCTTVLMGCISLSTNVDAQQADNTTNPSSANYTNSFDQATANDGANDSGSANYQNSFDREDGSNTEVGNNANTEVGNTANTEVSNMRSSGSRSLLNPLACSPGAQAKGLCIPELLAKVIDIILIFALPIIVLYIMYAGYLFVTAAGNSEKISAARSALLWSIIGGVIVLGARIIVSIIQGTISGLA